MPDLEPAARHGVPRAFLDALVPLQSAEIAGDEHRLSTRGTALALDAVLLTSRHLVEPATPLHTRLGPPERPERFRLPTADPDGRPLWRGHPEPAVDLAALRVALPTPSAPTPLARDALSARPLAAGEPVLVCGYHPDVVPGGKPAVIVRSARVALAPPTAYGGGHGFLLDAAVVPGQSGSIVLCSEDDDWRLAGIVEGYLPSRRSLIDSRTGRPSQLIEESSGLAVALTAAAIAATLDQT